MTTKETSQTQKNSGEAVFELFAEMQGRAFDQARKTIEESAKLAVHTIDYVDRLSAEWRKLATEAAKNTAGKFGNLA